MQWSPNQRFYVSPDKHLAYLNIHKNGSTTMRNIVEKLNFSECDISSLPIGVTVMIVLREDIIMRWISDITTYLHLDYRSIIDAHHITNALTQIVFDDHSAMQSSFLRGTEDFNRVFFKLGVDFKHTIKHFMYQNGYDIPSSKYKNSTKQKTGDELRNYHTIKDHALMAVHNNRLVTFFQDDYHLIEKTTFYKDTIGSSSI